MKAFRFLLLLITFSIALLLGVLDYMGRVDLVCREASCMKVQTSSFSRFLSIPTPIFAAIILLLALILFKRDRWVLYLVSFTVGCEAYLTFLQAFFIRSFCKICLGFFAALLVLFFLYMYYAPKKGVLIAIFSFLLLHFAFFFPSLGRIPWEPLVEGKGEKIILYMSPSCPHCEEAKKFLSNFVKGKAIELIYRPISLSQRDKEKVLRLISKGSKDPILERVADKISWQNEEELRRLEGRVAVPVAVLFKGGKKKVIRGWVKESAEEVEAFFGEIASSPLYHGLPFITPQEEEGICTESGPCR